MVQGSGFRAQGLGSKIYDCEIEHVPDRRVVSTQLFAALQHVCSCTWHRKRILLHLEDAPVHDPVLFRLNLQYKLKDYLVAATVSGGCALFLLTGEVQVRYNIRKWDEAFTHGKYFSKREKMDFETMACWPDASNHPID